jgi:hypothetical protein
MSTPTPPTLTGWWDFAVGAATALTSPRTNVDACDRTLEALARESRIGRAIHRLSVVSRSAWASSRVRSMLTRFASMLTSGSGTSRWRIAGWMVTVTGATALGLSRLGTIPAGPLTWVVPVLLVASGIFVMAAAAPLSRAAADRRLRQPTS